MKKVQSFDEWTGGLTEEELIEVVARVKKRYRMFLLISIIPVVNWITMGCALYCYNNLCYLKSRGRYEGNNIFRFILMVYAYIIPPIIIVQLAARINSLGDRILFGSKKK